MGGFRVAVMVLNVAALVSMTVAICIDPMLPARPTAEMVRPDTVLTVIGFLALNAVASVIALRDWLNQ